MSACSAIAQTVIDGSTVVIPGTYASPWNISALYIGHSGTGALEIGAGGQVSSDSTIIGHNVGSNGTAKVSGALARWETGALDVGYEGYGVLTVSNGGQVITNESFDPIPTTRIGEGPNGVGVVTVTGEGSSWSNGNGMIIGFIGNGSMEISAGGSVSGTFAVAGFENGGTGKVTVSGSSPNGSPSQWINSGYLVVGWFGNSPGSLDIKDGGKVRCTSAYIGSESGSSGSVTIGSPANSPNPLAAPGTLEASQAIFGNGAGALVFNHSDTSGSYVFAPVITSGSASRSPVDVYAGATVMTGVGSRYYGPTTVHGGTLAAGKAGVFSLRSAYEVQSAGTLNLQGHDQTVGSLATTGRVNLNGSAAPGATLTVSGNYSGGGRLIMSGALDGNGPTDLLVVNGDISGTTVIDYTGQSGAPTTGDGILVVQALGASPGNAFKLGKDPLPGGSYQYKLVQGALPGNEKNWYLQASPRATPLATPVPTLSHAALVLLALLLMVGAAKCTGPNRKRSNC